MQFVSLPRPTKPPTMDGSWIGDIKGHPALLGREGADPKPRSAMPSIDFRKGRNYAGITYFVETSKDKHLFHVVCFACNMLWDNRWHYAEVPRKDGTADPVSSVVMPKLEGTGVIYLPNGKVRRCTCTMGRTLQMRLDFASNSEIEIALATDAEMTHQGRIMFSGGQHASKILEHILQTPKE
jgi:hypothetical protein